MKCKKILFGKSFKWGFNSLGGRYVWMVFPAKDEDDIDRKIKFASDDGIILYLIKRIEKLENKKK